MKVKKLLLAFVLCSAFVLPAHSQDSGVGPAIGSNLSSGGQDGLGVKKYMLGPGDELDLRVFGEPQFSGALVVNDEGNLEVPFVDEPIPALCRTDREIKNEIVQYLSKYIKRPQVSLRVTRMVSRPPAVVFGAVRNPTAFDMRRRVYLLELLARSGSVTEAASGDVQIFHTEPVMCPEPQDLVQAAIEKKTDEDALALPYSIYRISDLRAGKKEANPYIRPGDIVIVQEAMPIYVTGAVVAPSALYLRENLSLSRVIAQVGGVRKGAKTDKVRIVRTKPGGELEPEVLVFNLDEIRKNKQPDVLLKPYDIIDVSDGSPWSLKNLPLTLLGMASQTAQGVVTAGSYRIIQ